MIEQDPQSAVLASAPAKGVPMLRRLVIWAMLLALAIVMLITFGRHAFTWMERIRGTDYFALYSAGATMTYDYDRLIGHELQTQQQLGKGPFYLRFPYPPHLLYVLVPFARLPFTTSHVLFSLLNFLLLALGFALVNGRRVAGWLALLAFQPVYENLMLGQYAGIVFLGYALLVWAERQKRPARWTILGLVLLTLKPQFALFPFVYMYAQGRWRRRASLYAAALAFLAVSIAFIAIGLDEIPKAVDMALGVVSGEEYRLFDVRTEFGPPFLFWMLWAGGLLFAFFAKPNHFQWVILLSILISPTVAAHDLIYLLVLIPYISSDYALVVIALAPLLALGGRSVVKPIFVLYAALGAVILLAKWDRREDRKRHHSPSSTRIV
jgi:hypothetical protein